MHPGHSITATLSRQSRAFKGHQPGRLGQLLCVLSLLLALLAGCSSPSEAGLQIYAASSLKECFTELKEIFERQSVKRRVHLTFAGSQTLRMQIQHGAPADIFVSANLKHVHLLHQAGLMGKPQILATNQLALIVPKDNPAKIQSWFDLPGASRIIIGNAEVPIGRYSRLALGQTPSITDSSFAQRVFKKVVSEENNVRLIRAKIELGQGDAAIVYESDALSSDKVTPISLPPEVQVEATYALGVLKSPRVDQRTRPWLDFLKTPVAHSILKRHGFRGAL